VKLLEPPSSNESLRIQKYAKLLHEGGLPSVYANKVREQAGKSKLSESVVKEIFEKAGVSVLNSDIKDWLPLLTSDTDMKIISENISLLKLTKDSAGTDFSRLNNLFDFVAYILDDLPNASTYPAKAASMLLSYVMPKASMYSSGTTEFAHAWQRLCTASVTKIFNTEDNCRAYKNSLKYEEIKAELGDSIRLMSKDDLKSSFLAEIIIARFIAKGFSNNEAIALYNKLAVMVSDPYMPEQPVFIVKCEACGSLNRFLSIKDAEKGKCGCGMELYTKCPNCGKPTPKTSDYCINCSFLVAGIKNFAIYHQKALDALALFDFLEARKNASNAKLANPKDPRAAALEKRINDESAKFEKPLREIETLKSEKKLKEALRKAREAARLFPQLSFSDLQASIARLDKMFADSKRLATAAEKVAVCEKILAECVDHDEAMFFLSTEPPRPSAGIRCSCDGKSACVNVSWDKSPDSNVTYTLARKEGGIPVNPDERGVAALLRDASQTFFCDTKVASGIEYGYAVFAKRAGVFSVGTADRAVLCQDVGCLNITEDSADGVLISWETPANCSKVEIFRKSKGIPAIGDILSSSVYKGQGGSFHDRGLSPSQLYGYRIQAAYATAVGELSSQGLTFSFKIRDRLEPFGLDVSMAGATATFSALGLRRECTVQVIKLKAPIEKSKVVKVSDLKNLGTSLATFPSSAARASVEIPENSFFDVAAFAYFSNDAISSDTREVNTYLPLQLASPNPRFVGSDIVFTLKDPIPANAKFVCYGLKNGNPYWTSPSELSPATKVSIAIIKRSRNEILIKNPSDMRGACYLTLYTEYESNGHRFLSAPDKSIIKVPMTINVDYRAVARKGRKAVELTIKVKVVKGRIDSIPRLNLFAGNVLIATTNEIPIRNNEGSFTNTYADISLPSAPVRARLAPVSDDWLEDLSIRYMQGYRGDI
jgi:hypothetical protein